MLPKARDVERLDIVGLGQLHLAGLQGQCAALAVRNDAVDEFIEIRLARDPILVEALHADEVAALPLDELERPGANWLLVGGLVR